MSFVLTFFHAPSVATPDAAAEWLGQASEMLPEPTTRWADFIREVSQYYPDLSGDEDLQERNLWPEGLEEIAPRSASTSRTACSTCPPVS